MALDGVDFSVLPGEVHALLGENGAGKSTLVNVLYGLVAPDAGEIRINGQAVALRSPAQAMQWGIGMVHQHFMLVPDFTVAENVMLGGSGLARAGAAACEVERLCRLTGLTVDPQAITRRLSVGEQQRVEILKALHRGARLLILDEPTGVLAPPEVEDLFRVVRRLREAGHSVVFITHKLREALAVCDRVTVLRRGSRVLTAGRSEVTLESLAAAMIGEGASTAGPGSQAVAPSAHPLPHSPPPTPLLELRDLRVRADAGHEAVRGVSLEVRAGEIMGVAGVEGNGQNELAEAIAGLRPMAGGRMLFCGRDVAMRGAVRLPADALAYIPSDRQQTALILSLSIWENLILHSHARPPMRRGAWIDRHRAREAAAELVREYDIRTAGVDLPAGSLSGGNQQKLVVARELARQPRLLLAVNPTRGIDFAAAAQIHARIRAHRDAGGSTLLFSIELEELALLSDRVAVMFDGVVAGVLPPDAGLERFGELMTGARAA